MIIKIIFFFSFFAKVVYTFGTKGKSTWTLELGLCLDSERWRGSFYLSIRLLTSEPVCLDLHLGFTFCLSFLIDNIGMIVLILGKD